MTDTLIPAKKGKGLDDVIGRLVPEVPDTLLRQPSGSDPVLETFRSFLQLNDDQEVLDILLKAQVTYALDPARIDAYFQQFLVYEAESNWDIVTGLFTSKLIQDSYLHGHNNFKLTTRMNTNESLLMGSYLRGTKEKPINITIDGDRHEMFGSNSHYVHSIIQGSVGGQCGEESKNCSYEIDEKWGCNLGREAVESIFYLKAAPARTVHQMPDCRCGLHAQKCTFTTSDKDALEQLKHVPRGNRIIYLKEEIVHGQSVEVKQIVRDYDG